MSLIKCEKCGEMFSETYKKCPFCVEDEEFYNGRVKKFNRRKVEKRHQSPSIVGPAMILIIVIVAFALVWTFFGEDLRALFGDMKKNNEVSVPSSSAVESVNQETKTEETKEPEVILIAIEPTSLEMKVGDSETLVVTGAESYSWLNSDPSVISITNKGLVTALGEGTATVTVTDPTGNTAICSVTVAGEGENTEEPAEGTTTETPEQKPEETSKPETSKPTQNSSTTKVDKSKLSVGTMYGPLKATSDGSYDITLTKDEALEMSITGTDATITWKSSNTNVATVSEKGTIKGIKSGNADVTATVGDVTIDFLIRVN